MKCQIQGKTSCVRNATQSLMTHSVNGEDTPSVLCVGGETMTRVVHCKKEPYDVYIGRPSKWGNPFIIGKDGTREEVIDKYEAYIMDRPDLIEALPELQGKVLGCWCKPKACHGDVLVRMIENEIWLK